jgi:phosphatidate cytidylyltransferase
MLKLRVLSALVAAPAVIAAIFLLDVAPFAVLFGVLAMVALTEWARLAGIQGAAGTSFYLLVFAGLATGLWLVPSLWPWLLGAMCLVWVGAMAVVVRFPASGAWLKRPVLMALGWGVALAAWLALVVLKSAPAGPWLLVWLFVLVWGADIGAYFAGRRFGRHKLAPAVSPGKTWEGVMGGLALAGAVCMALALWAVPLAGVGWPVSTWLALIAVLIPVSVFGDLFESALKRHSGVKDSGRLFPGHGGLLDRIDSLLAVLPFFALFLLGPQSL